jgi:hypothetical protein
VQEWIKDNWNRWEEEQPLWFTEALKLRLDDGLLPAAELVRQKAAVGGSRRRTSVFQELVGGADGDAVGAAQVFPEPPV